MNITLNDLLFALSKTLDFVEQDLLGVTTNHSKRVANMSMILGKAMGSDENEIFDIASYSILHDNALTTYMLKLEEKDYNKLENIKIHCKLGENNVASFPFQGSPSGVILYHHENWDGSGFYKLKKDTIPLHAAIIRIADNLDLNFALGTPQNGLMDKVLHHIHTHKGSLYSPLVVEAFADVITKEHLQGMIDKQIDISLAETMPTIGHHLSPEELLQVCQVFAKIIDAKSNFTLNHSQGTAQIVALMGRSYGFDEHHCFKLEIAGLLHDIGKLAIPVHILEKPGPLTQEEHAVILEHPAITLEVLQGIEGLEEIAQWAGNHHERLDGSGYGSSLERDELCFESRLIACCDVYQALTEERPYRAAFNHATAISIMRDMVAQNLVDGDIVEDLAQNLKNHSS